jgi:hypothetical protein
MAAWWEWWQRQLHGSPIRLVRHLDLGHTRRILAINDAPYVQVLVANQHLLQYAHVVHVLNNMDTPIIPCHQDSAKKEIGDSAVKLAAGREIALLDHVHAAHLQGWDVRHANRNHSGSNDQPLPDKRNS